MNQFITISVTEEQYAFLTQAAAEKGMSVQRYVKQCAVPDPEYDACYEKLIWSVEHLPEGEFCVKSLFGDAWKGVPDRIRRTLGRAFFDAVSAGSVPGVTPTRKRENAQWYRKEA